MKLCMFSLHVNSPPSKMLTHSLIFQNIVMPVNDIWRINGWMFVEFIWKYHYKPEDEHSNRVNVTAGSNLIAFLQ